MNIKLFLPDSLLRSNACFIRGCYAFRDRDRELVVYMTAQATDSQKLSAGRKSTPDCVYGRYGASGKLPREHSRNTIDVNSNGHIYISDLVIDRKQVSLQEHNVVIIFYDYDTLSVAENWQSTDRTFSELRDCVTLERRLNEETKSYPERDNTISTTWSLLSTSVFCVQLKNFADILMWTCSVLWKSKKISLKTGNMMAALLMDIMIGCLVLRILNVRSEQFSDIIMGYIEVVVNYLRSLLKWLMGAPAGLKLNNAFNNMLGKFFLYHIDLWWMFLELTKGGLHIVSQLYYYFGYLGITFQAAIISDMICFISFHAYCIYVYVARLFNIQVSGMTALLRLFVGRKRNPLRGGVDSCEYTNQQLFVGTVAFTALLFLLPTTAMYYIVFTLFRMLSLAVQGALARLCYCIKTLPLYVTFLYLVGSPRVAGNIHMEVLRDAEESLPLVLRVMFTTQPLGVLVGGSRPPPVPAAPPIRWTLILSKIFKGNLISS